MKLLISSLLLGISLFAQDNLPKESYYPHPFAQEKPLVEGYCAPARVDVRGSWDLFLWGNFLYWQPSEDGLEFAFGEDNRETPPSQTLISPHASFHPGFQAGVGVNGNRDGWDFRTWYTWFRCTDHETQRMPANATLQPLWFDSLDDASKVSSKWKISLQEIDAQIGREFYAGKAFTLRPSFAVTAIWFLQRYNITADIISLGVPKRSFNRARNWALGPKFGIDAGWHLGHGLNIFMNSAIALFYSKYNIRLRSQTLTTVNDQILLQMRKKIAFVRPYFEIISGLQYGFYFSNDGYHLSFYASYDFRLFWNQNVMRQLLDSVENLLYTDYGNLTLQGGTAGFRFDF